MSSRFERRQFLQRLAALGSTPLLSALATTVHAATGAAAAPQRGGILRISVNQAANVLNPLRARVNPEYLVAELLYSSLTRLNHDLQAEPDLADTWTPNADLTQWVFHLRPNLIFHDGTPCTAKDVEASLNFVLDPKNASPARNNIGPIQHVQAQGENQVVITTRGPYADLPIMLAFTDARIVPAAIIAAGKVDELSHRAIGTGPFKLVSFDPNRLVAVERNPHYYDPTRPYLDRVEVVVYPDAIAESSALISGDLDMISMASSTEFPRLQSAAGIDALRVPSGQFLNVNMGCNQAPFDDMRVRQALAYCVDRKAMVDFVANGFGAPGNDNPVSQAYPFYKALPLKAQDIQKAKDLLNQAGHPGGLDLTLIASDKPSTRTQLGIALQSMAKPAGFRIKVQTMPQATYLDQVWKKGKFYVGFYNMQATVDAVFSLLYTSDATWNETHWNNAAFDTLVRKARGVTDKTQRADYYARAQALMSEQVPSVIPVFYDLLGAKHAYVQGYQLNPRGVVYQLDSVWLDSQAPKRRAS